MAYWLRHHASVREVPIPTEPTVDTLLCDNLHAQAAQSYVNG